MPKPKITIVKKFMLSDGRHWRFYSPMYDGKNRKTRPKAVTFDMDLEKVHFNKFGEPYPKLNVRTERELAEFLFNTFGEGEYWIFAHMKHRKGIWTFWRGSVQRDGWMFNMRNSVNPDAKALELDMKQAETQDDFEYIKELYDKVKTDEKDKTAKKRYGFAPFLRPSGRRGQFNMWDEPDQALETQQKPKSQRRNVDIEDMTLDDINAFE